MRLSRASRWSVVVVAVIVAAACLDRTPATSLETVTCQVSRKLSSLVAFIAEEEGFFRDEGLAVEMVFWDHGAAVIPALARGEIDVGSSGRSITGYINVIHRGARIRLVAARTVNDPNQCGYYAFVGRTPLILSLIHI